MTNQNLTFNTLDSYFLNTGSMKLNIGYLRDSITAYFYVTERNTNGGNGKSLLQINLENTRRSIKSLVWEAFQSMTNDYLENETGSRKYTCTSAQLKKYLDQYGFTLDEALKPVINEAQFHNMENCLYIKGGDRPEIKQYCCYAECNAINHTYLAR